MKKYLIISICICLLLCGCGKKKTKENVSSTVKESDIGSIDVIYKLALTCGDKAKDSYVTLNKDRTAIYAIYECNNDNLELMYGEGTYEIDGSKVTITDTYSNTLSITVNGNDTIDLNFDGIKQTLTK